MALYCCSASAMTTIFNSCAATRLAQWANVRKNDDKELKTWLLEENWLYEHSNRFCTFAVFAQIGPSGQY